MSQTKCIASVERISSSVDGNALLVTFTDGTIGRTQSDADCASEIGNPGLRPGSMVAVRFSRRGSITTMSRVTRVE